MDRPSCPLLVFFLLRSGRWAFVWLTLAGGLMIFSTSITHAMGQSFNAQGLVYLLRTAHCTLNTCTGKRHKPIGKSFHGIYSRVLFLRFHSRQGAERKSSVRLGFSRVAIIAEGRLKKFHKPRNNLIRFNNYR